MDGSKRSLSVSSCLTTVDPRVRRRVPSTLAARKHPTLIGSTTTQLLTWQNSHVR